MPRLLVVAGPNGSGKTTLTNRLRRMGLDFGEYINADEIALAMPADPDRDRRAQQEATRRREVCLSERRDFSFETVMSHPSKIDEMRAAREAGYLITFIFVALESPALNVARVSQRVASGGHDVPEDRIIARYNRVMGLLPEALLLADRFLVFDNSDFVHGPHLAMTGACREADTTICETHLHPRTVGEAHYTPRWVLDRFMALADLCRLRGIAFLS